MGLILGKGVKMNIKKIKNTFMVCEKKELMREEYKKISEKYIEEFCNLGSKIMSNGRKQNEIKSRIVKALIHLKQN